LGEIQPAETHRSCGGTAEVRTGDVVGVPERNEAPVERERHRVSEGERQRERIKKLRGY
jgi:hypothetical protein